MRGKRSGVVGSPVTGSKRSRFEFGVLVQQAVEVEPRLE